MKRSVILVTALLATSGTAQAQSDPYVAFALLSFLYREPAPVLLAVEILNIVSTEFDDPFDINRLNIVYEAADDQNDPMQL
jgi:hypothetical protein